MNRTLRLLGGFVVAISLGSAGSFAAEQYHDTRNHMDHYYPARGASVGALPSGHVPVYDHAHNPYYFHGGVWYRPYGGRFIVVAPPAGVFVPFLPAYYTTLWIGGYPYYYANDTYYTWDPAQGEYQVVEPPGESAASTDAPAITSELYSYPKNGQTPQQQEQDRYECHRWAVDQSGFDPTQSAGGTPPDPVKRPAYRHAMTSCLEGRGYSVK